MVKFGNFLRKSSEAFGANRKTGWEGLEQMGQARKFESPVGQGTVANAPVSAMSPDVARMQAQMRKIQEMQAAREKVMRSFDKNFDRMNKVAGVDRFQGQSQN